MSRGYKDCSVVRDWASRQMARNSLRPSETLGAFGGTGICTVGPLGVFLSLRLGQEESGQKSFKTKRDSGGL